MEFDSLLKVLDEEKDFAKEHYIPIIRPESSKILYDIVSSYNPNTILEIGTAIGFSGSSSWVVFFFVDNGRMDQGLESFPAEWGSSCGCEE